MELCEKYIEKMNAYLDGALPAAEISSLLEHMHKCESCRARFDALNIVSFEMRHMKVEAPKDLHASIMAHVKASKKPLKFAYARVFATVAAAAAITLFAVKSDIINVGSTFLFGAQPSIVGEALPTKIDDGAAEPPITSEPEPFSIAEPKITEPVAPPQNRADESEATEPQLPQEAPIEDAPAIEPRVNAAVPSSPPSSLKMVPEDGEAQAAFRVPRLDTDEEFAFYCVATGDAKIPKEFPSEAVFGDVEAGPIYIYIKNSDTAREDAQAALKRAGFKIERDATNLPQVDESMEFGLVVIFRK